MKIHCPLISVDFHFTSFWDKPPRLVTSPACGFLGLQVSTIAPGLLSFVLFFFFSFEYFLFEPKEVEGCFPISLHLLKHGALNPFASVSLVYLYWLLSEAVHCGYYKAFSLWLARESPLDSFPSNDRLHSPPCCPVRRCTWAVYVDTLLADNWSSRKYKNVINGYIVLPWQE